MFDIENKRQNGLNNYWLVKIDTINLANYILFVLKKNERKINNFELQCLLYYVQVAGLKNKMIIIENDFVAGSYFPMIIDVYFEFIYCDLNPIIDFIKYDIINNDSVKSLINKVVLEKSSLNLTQMIEQITSVNGAWNKTRKREIIPLELINEENIDLSFLEEKNKKSKLKKILLK